MHSYTLGEPITAALFKGQFELSQDVDSAT